MANPELTPLERQLLQVQDGHVEQIHRALQWLVFGPEPLQHDPGWNRPAFTLPELEAASVPEGAHVTLDFVSILDLLEGLVECDTGKPYGSKPWCETAEKTTLKLKDWAQDELLSERFRFGPAGKFACDEAASKEMIAHTCLSLLIAVGSGKVKGGEPLASFAALYWFDFIDPSKLSTRCTTAIEELFLGEKETFEKWIELLLGADNASPNNKHKCLVADITTCPKSERQAPPLVFAAATGIKFVVRELLQRGVYVNETGETGVTALYMAVHEKHFDIASLLLEAGGDVADDYKEPWGKFEYGWTSSPLYLASHFGRHWGFSREWMDLLLKDRTKLGKPGWRLEVAMASASRSGYLECLKALVSAGADVDKPSGMEESYGCPLQAACDRANEETVRFLLENGANPNVTGGNIWLGSVSTPLQMAAWRGNVTFVTLLLNYGADPNIEGGEHGTPLIASTWNAHQSPKDGQEDVLKLLLDHGARVDVEWDMTPKLYELNFTYSEARKTPLSELFGQEMAKWIQSPEYDQDDKSELSEATLRDKIENKWERIHEGKRLKKYGYACGCMNDKAFQDRFKIIFRIRKAAARISKRLLEAGVCSSPTGKHLMSPIQAAIAMERPSLVELLLQHGASMPAVIVCDAAQEVAHAEGIARLLRARDVFSYGQRSKEGGLGMSGSQMLP